MFMTVAYCSTLIWLVPEPVERSLLEDVGERLVADGRRVAGADGPAGSGDAVPVAELIPVLALARPIHSDMANCLAASSVFSSPSLAPPG